MVYLTWIYYVLFAALLLAGCRFFGRGKWNDDVMSFDHTKAFLGFSAIGIILHHCAENTCASWLNPAFIRPGLEFFVNVGYLFVAAFFFCSGYGLLKSSRKGDAAFKGYFRKRFIPLLIPTVLSALVFVILYQVKGMQQIIPNPFTMGGTDTVNPYAWYVYVLVLFYLMFFVCFRLIKKEGAGIIVMALFTVALSLFFLHFEYGTWWFNSYHLFVIGILFARYEEKIASFSKRFYIPLLIVMFVVTVVTFYVGNYTWDVVMMLKIKDISYEDTFWVRYLCMLVSAFTSVYLTYLAGLKMKIGNPVLKYLGKQTLEIYLFQPIFVNLFAYRFVSEGTAPLYYIKNVPLYTLVIIVTTLLTAFAVHLLDAAVTKAVKKGIK